jgi:hypothetical protein
MFSVELEFLLDNPKWFPRDFTLYSPIEDIIWDIFYSIWKFLCRDDLLNLREWSLIVTPVESKTQSFRLLERIILIRDRLIVSKWTHRCRKEFSPFSIRYHLLYDTRDKRFIFFFRILLIEDAVGFIAESDTAKEITTTLYFRTIIYIIRVICKYTKMCMRYRDC